MQSPSPGIYRNVPARIYHLWDAVHSSGISVLAGNSPHRPGGTPAHYRYAELNPTEAGQEAIWGTGVHSIVLGGEATYLAEFAIGGPINPTTNRPYGRDTKKFEEYRSANPGKEILTAEEDAKVRAMAKSLLEEEDIKLLIYGGTDNEVSLVWQDPETELTCKARLDMPRPKYNTIGDIKTSGNLGAFGVAVDREGYHRQAAFYLDGASLVYSLTKDHLLCDLCEFAWAAVENVPPYVSGGWRATEEMLAIGHSQNERYMSTIAKCKKSGKWPGYGAFHDIHLSQSAIYRERAAIIA